MRTRETETEIPAKTEKLFKIVGDWNEQASKLKEKYPSLTDGDLKVEAGRENEMLKSMEARLHMNRDEVMEIIDKNISGKN